jgi:hypothetical protein
VRVRWEGDVVSWLSKDCRRSGRYQRTMEFLSATSSRLLAANVILRVWAGARQGLGRLAGKCGHWQVLFSAGATFI